ncbi:dihydroorotate oxidase A [Tamaricihabitans halophyticus]|uniref:Dihydroorotate dehydrogenase (quinone) n=1 Tax=Tamaricihabitans halophyticus TaxID=1262583 RepID=A0A4R2PY15_9PSEU|nr:quinone-dependent dihydroorotate dehydrogenase [Tamaricihabitans halophyticus]TCP41132.1 dihydroorotate oxidase A [Tamaricihabitans halophyticus]
MIYEKLIRRALFRTGGGNAEIAHERVLGLLAKLRVSPPALHALRRYYAVAVPTDVFGLRFPNPVGLAAGMDKDGHALPCWSALGFGFLETGTVTRLPQPGNPKPRLFRLPDSEGIINRMGFNNAGADALAETLRTTGPLDVPLGVSIGKSKATALEDAVADYRYSLRGLYPYADYFAINISSPNTPGLRVLQDRTALTELLAELQLASTELAAEHGRRRPLLVKIAPDLTDEAIAELLEVCDEHKVNGVIATNTTIERTGLAASDAYLGKEIGGLSGRPLANRAREIVSFVHRRTEGALPIIGVGGIFGAHDAERMLDAGASLVQVFTGFIYRGPGMIREINRALAERA